MRACLGSRIMRVFRAAVIAAAAALCLPPLQAQAADRGAPDIVVTCGTHETRISTGRRLRNIAAIRITVDPAAQCRVEASLQFKTGGQDRQAVPVAIKSAKPRPRVSDLPASRRKCFVFAGRSYCE
jgi:hypothetical protein